MGVPGPWRSRWQFLIRLPEKVVRRALYSTKLKRIFFLLISKFFRLPVLRDQIRKEYFWQGWKALHSIRPMVMDGGFSMVLGKLTQESLFMSVRKSLPSYKGELKWVKRDPEFIQNPKQHLEGWNSSYPAQKLRSEALLKSKLKQQKQNSDLSAKKILFVTQGNWNFMQGIMESFEQDPELQIRSLDFEGLPRPLRPSPGLLCRAFFNEEMGEEHWRKAKKDAPYFTEYFEWADVIYVDWANGPAIWLSRYLPPEKKLVVRLHSYEAFSHWSSFMNWGGVDELIFVAPHIRDFCNEQFEFSDYPNLKLSVIPNYNELSGFQKEKSPGAEFCLGMAGYNSANKDPIEALKILKEMRQQDSRWTLRFVGHPFNESHPEPTERDYGKRFHRYIAENNLSEAVSFESFTHDIPTWFTKVGYILSTSQREGTHETLLQGMASGCQPVVRNWPLVAKWNAAKSLYPMCVPYESVDEAVEILISRSQNISFSQLEPYDSSRVVKRFKSLLVSSQA